MPLTVSETEIIDRKNHSELSGSQGRSGRVTVDLHSSAESAACLSLWRDLDDQLGDGSLACSWEWTRTWLDYYGDLVAHRFAVARRGRTPCGIGLVTYGVDQTDGPFPVRSLHVGTAGEPDSDSVCVEYNGLLVEADCRGDFLKSLLRRLSQESGWDEICLDGFAQEHIRGCLAQRDRFDWSERESFYFDLAAVRESSGQVLDQIGYSTRKNIRKNLKAYGSLQTEWSETVEQAESIFDEMVRLHQARWTAAGYPGSYSSERFREFHRSLIRRLLPDAKAGLFRVTCNGGIVGCVQLLIDRDRVLCYQGGSAPYRGKLSPGMVVDYLCIEECLRRGFDAYDFLCGDSHHKRKLSTDSNCIVWARRRRPRIKFFALQAARSIKRAARQFRRPKKVNAEANAERHPTARRRRTGIEAKIQNCSKRNIY